MGKQKLWGFGSSEVTAGERHGKIRREALWESGCEERSENVCGRCNLSGCRDTEGNRYINTRSKVACKKLF